MKVHRTGVLSNFVPPTTAVVGTVRAHVVGLRCNASIATDSVICSSPISFPGLG